MFTYTRAVNRWPSRSKKNTASTKNGSSRLTAKLGELGASSAYETFEENYLHRGGMLDDADRPFFGCERPSERPRSPTRKSSACEAGFQAPDRI